MTIIIARSYYQGIPGAAGADGLPGIPGSSSSFVTSAPATIPASGGVTVVLSSGILGDGQFVDVVVNGINGVLSRAGLTYPFTRSTAGSTLAIPSGSVFVAISSAIGITAGSTGLTSTGPTVGLMPTGGDVDLTSRKIFDQELTNPNGLILMPDGSLVAPVGIMAADAAGAAFSNAPAQDVTSLSNNLFSQARIALDPNGQYARGFEQSQSRQAAQQFNQDQKIANEVAKRNFMVDQYRQAQQIGGNAINSYLEQQARSRDGMRSALLTRY
jgi:hypothetical protein